MEQHQLVGIPDAFGPRRKQLLKSETYFSLHRLFSFCDENPHLWKLSLPKLPPPEPKPGSNSSDESERKACDKVGSTENYWAHVQTFESLDFDGNGNGETNVVIDEIESIMRVDEDEDQLMNNGYVVEKIMELDHLMKGNDVFGILPVDDNKSGGVIVGDDRPIGIHSLGDSRIANAQKLQSIHELSALDFASGEKRDSRVLQESQDSGFKLTEVNLETPICAVSAMICPNRVVVGDDAEEGEIYGDSKVVERADVKSSGDEIVLQGMKLDEKQLSIDVIDGTGSRKQSATNAAARSQTLYHSRTGASKDNRCSSFSAVDRVENNKDKVDISMVSNRKAVVYNDLLSADGEKIWQEGDQGRKGKGQRIISTIEKRNKDNRGREVGEIKRPKEQNIGSAANGDVGYSNLHVEKSSQDPGVSQGSADCDKKDATLCIDVQKDATLANNKKRGPLTDSQKETRKKNKRKKRAEKNKELGVKRLKLQPVVNEKPVGVCRHYMKGTCWESEKCKFSHDAIPLTKSEPCRFFARASCMKGDDCTRDHQLSKYPCSLYTSTGSCSRGAKCLFSHKDLPNGEVSTTSSVNPESPVLTGNAGAKSGRSVCEALAVASARIRQVGRKTALNAPAVAPAGIAIHSARKSSLGGSNRTLQGCPSVRAKDTLNTNHTDQHPSSVAGSSNTTLKGTPPAGIAIHSAGKSSLGGSNRTLQGSPSVTAKDTSNTNHTDQHSSGVAGNSNTILKGTPPAATPKGINFLSFGKSSLQLFAAKQSSVAPISQVDSLKSPLPNTSSQCNQASDAGKSVLIGSVTAPSECNVNSKTNEMAQNIDHVTASPKPGRNRYLQACLPSSSDGGICSGGEGSKTGSHENHSLNARHQGLPSSSNGSGLRALLQLKNVPNSTQKSLMSTLAFAAQVESDMKRKQMGTGTSNVLRTSNDESK